MERYALTFLFLSVSIAGVGQVKAQVEKSYTQKLYTSTELKEDYAIFRKALESTYPSLYRFTDSATITQHLLAKQNSLKEPMTEMQFFKLIVSTCARANDEHLIPTPSKQYYQYLEKATHYFPFSLKIIDRRLYVLKSFKLDTLLPVGSEIISINGHSAEEILNMLLPTISSDGYIQTFNLRHLEDYSMTQNGNLFDLNYPIFFEDTAAFRIEFIHPLARSEKKVITLAALDGKVYREFYRQRLDYRAPLEFNYLTNNIAYLRISSFLKWHRSDFKQDFYVLYDSIFNKLNQKRTTNLILDLRNNEGGDGTGEKLITYLLTKPYKHYSYTEEKFVGYPSVVNYLENGKDLFFLDSLVYRTDRGMYRLKPKYYNDLYKMQQTHRNHYKGNLYVLVNGASGSMASVVATFLKAHKRAVFIGEETGGTMEGNTSDAYAQLVLPHTGIRVEIPLTQKVHNVDYVKGRGVFPDHFIVPSIEDITKGADTELNFTLKLITSHK